MTDAAEARFGDHLLAPSANPIYQFEVCSIWSNERKRYIRLVFEKCIKQKRRQTIIQVVLSSLKGVTLEGKSFGLSGD